MSYKPISLFLPIALLWAGSTARAQLSPSVVTLGPSQQQQFSLHGQQANWTVLPPGTGTITSTGLYTAPSSVSKTNFAFVYAESGSISYEAQVQLSPTRVAGVGSTSALLVSPSFVYLYGGQSTQFLASIGGSADQQVVWSVTQGVGRISKGTYYAPAVSTDTLVTITATSALDPTQTASATVLVGPAFKPGGPATPTGGATSTGGSTTPSSSTSTSGGTTTNNVSTSNSGNITSNVSTSNSGTTTNNVSTSSSGATANDVSNSSSGTTPNNLTASSSDPTSTSFAPIRVAAGAGQYVDPQGNVWSADHGYSGPTGIYSTTAQISGTTLPVLYQNLRYGPQFQYNFPVPAGTYTVTLKFAEIVFSTVGSRVFNVAINNQAVLTNFDIVAQAGGVYAALDKTFTVPASNGQINIQFSASVNDAQINAIQIVQQTASTSGSTSVGGSTPTSGPPTTSFTPIRVASGAGQYVDPQGNVWSADYGYSGPTGTYSTLAQITGTTLPVLYQNLRYGTQFQYNFSVPAGTYTVTLKFAEIVFSTVGSRVFNVAINNQAVLTNFDIVAQAGGVYAALDKTFTVPASSGQINIQFSASVNDAQINAIQIVQQSSQAVVSTTPVSVSLSPSSVSLSGGGSTQFTATVSNASSTAVTWLLSQNVGSVDSSGVYTAPATISANQSITVTATSVQDTTKSASATITLQAAPPTSVTPSTATVAPSGTQLFSVQNLPSGTSVAWSLSPATGSISANGLYTAPSNVATQQTVTVTATNSSTQSTLGTATLTLQASVPPATITLPIEVVGPNGTTASASFTVPQGVDLSGQLQLWMQIHNLKYDSEASVQVNNSAWLPISTGHVKLLGNAAAFGGIGGGFHTLQLTLNLPAGVVTAGTNTITFQFNGTDGVVSGFRVLAFNIQSAGSNLLPASQFVNDDPNAWQPPSSAASDIAAGQALYQSAPLTSPFFGPSQPIQAHCSDCHTVDGRDLKYFNYSNNSIQARALFHGLTAQQGNQIASYIRSLNVPNPGRPWNPPYQPGPGLDSQPVANWAAGAGIDAVLDNDSQMEPYMTPGGSTAGWSANSYLNPREMPVAIQLPDWNSWLPEIHPMDAFGSTFTNSPFNLLFPAIRNTLHPNSTSAYTLSFFNGAFTKWIEASGTFLVPIETNASNANWSGNLRAEVYSVSLWEMVKLWEVNQEFGLEGMPQVPFGAKANVRGWYGSQAFDTSPSMMHITAGPGIGNGTAVAHDYISVSWYQTQLVLNDGQGLQTSHNPIDYGYVYGSLKDVFADEASLPGILLQLEWNVKALQEFTLSGVGPQAGNGQENAGWDPLDTSMVNLVTPDWLELWSATSPATQATWLQAFTQLWFAQASQYTPQQYYQGGWASATGNPATLSFDETFAGQMWFSLPRLRYLGVDPNLINQIAAWAAKIWPQGNWSLNDSATCTSLVVCTSG